MFYQEKKTSVERNNQEQYMYFVQCGVGIICPQNVCKKMDQTIA